MALADSFVQAYHFRLLYMSTQLMYPIMGAMRHRYGKPWEVNHTAASLPFAICHDALCSGVESRVLRIFSVGAA